MTKSVAGRLVDGDPSLFVGATAQHALGWLHHPDRYGGPWLDEVSAALPRRFERTVLLGMGGSSAAARFFADARANSRLEVVDTSNPDTVASVNFDEATVIASSKSGATIETQALLAHALANGLDPRDLVVITDPETSLDELGSSLGALVIHGDPDTGGRFSGLSPFGLVPALCSGWSVSELRATLNACVVDQALVERAAEAATAIELVEGRWAFVELDHDPATSGGALWLEQLFAETTGKVGRGVIPIVSGDADGRTPYRVADIQFHHLVAALVARRLGVDPFDQPDVERAKIAVFEQLRRPVTWEASPVAPIEIGETLGSALYNTLQLYAPLARSSEVAALRRRIEQTYGRTTANLGPRYLHSTGQLHKGGPEVAALQVVVRPRSSPMRIQGRRYSFHDMHLAQARSDFAAMVASGRRAVQLLVDDLDEVPTTVGIGS